MKFLAAAAVAAFVVCSIFDVADAFIKKPDGSNSNKKEDANKHKFKVQSIDFKVRTV
jgi:hypothetical protein